MRKASPLNAHARYPLTKLKKNNKARIIALGPGMNSSKDSPAIKRLRDAGFEEDCEVEIMHTAPLGGDPIAVRVDGVTIALRRAEAALIEVELKEL